MGSLSEAALLFVSTAAPIDLKNDNELLELYARFGSVYAIKSVEGCGKALVLYNGITVGNIPSEVNLAGRNPSVTVSFLRPSALLLSQLQDYTGLSVNELASLTETYQKWSVGMAFTPQEKIDLARQLLAGYPALDDAIRQRDERIAKVLQMLTGAVKCGNTAAEAIDKLIPNILDTIRKHLGSLPEGLEEILKKIEETPVGDVLKTVEIGSLFALATAAVGVAEIADALATITKYRSFYATSVNRARDDLLRALAGILDSYVVAQTALEQQQWGAFATALKRTMAMVTVGKQVADKHVTRLLALAKRAEKASATEAKKAATNGAVFGTMLAFAGIADSKQELCANLLSAATAGAAGATQVSVSAQLERLSENLHVIGDVCSRISAELENQLNMGTKFSLTVDAHVKERSEEQLFVVATHIRPFLIKSIMALQVLIEELQVAANASTVPNFSSIRAAIGRLVPAAARQQEDPIAAEEVVC